ncbi:acyltransferase [Ruminococcus sp.]|uniref:acyltransferase n=1 Tax=Ruminococcus sp. TaxID=41978 RepID=UPI002584237C|nr:acyltransferase [Ruminococcus sp.]MCR5021832.1 acyltransferase [Ruminococcus sp.]
MNKISNKDIFWQQIRGFTILAVILIHCYSGADLSLNTVNGFSYFITRNLVNFPVDMFFFMSGFFMKPVDDVKAFYKKRLPKLIVPYLFYTCAYLGLSIVFGSGVSVKEVIFAFIAGTASTPLYYIVVLTYFTLLAPFLMKAVNNKKLSIAVLCSTPTFIMVAWIIRFLGTDIWIYLKYTPVWLSFYYLGMYIKANKPSFNRKVLWMILPIAFVTELISTYILGNVSGFNAYTQLRFSGAFYALILILLAYEYSKEQHGKNNSKWLTRIGDDSYAIYYMHCASLMVFMRVIKFGDNTILPLYRLCELLFAVLICVVVIMLIRKIFKDERIRLLFGV